MPNWSTCRHRLCRKACSFAYSVRPASRKTNAWVMLVVPLRSSRTCHSGSLSLATIMARVPIVRHTLYSACRLTCDGLRGLPLGSNRQKIVAPEVYTHDASAETRTLK